MIILFIGNNGVYHPLIAANSYLQTVEKAEISSLPYYADRLVEQEGKPFWVGTDSQGNQVYVLGVGYDVSMAVKSLQQLIRLLEFNEQIMSIKPIRVRGENLIMLLHRLARYPIMGAVTERLIGWIIGLNFDSIRKQVPLGDKAGNSRIAPTG